MMDQLSTLCRTCLASSKSLESLDTECEQGYSFKFMLTSFCTLQMDDISVMYDNICKDCSSEILRAYNFKLQCEQNDVLLREKARTLKYEEISKIEENYLSGVVEISIVKNEVEDVHVKEEDWMGGDDHRSSEDDETHNNADNRNEINTTCNKENKSSKSRKSPSAKVRQASGSKAKGKREKDEKKQTFTKQSRRAKQIVDKSLKKLGYKRIYECFKCGHLSKSINLIHNHLNKIHSMALKSVEEFDVMCVQERKARGIQESQEELKDMKKFDPKNPMYKCIECPHRCKDFEAMKKHIVEKHREAKYLHCPEEDCKFSTHRPSCFAGHMRIMHTDKRRFSCDKCDYKAHTKYAMDSHNNTKHLNIKAFVCHLCSKKYFSKQLLQIHIDSNHNKIRRYSCPQCTKAYYTRSHLSEHLKSHTGLKPHVCEHCGIAFTQKVNLDKHVFTSHTSTSEDRVLCSFCPHKAKNIYCLKTHVYRVHRSTARFQCDYCGKSFVKKSALKIHILRHMGQERYKCLTCSYTCDHKYQLQYHIMMKHTGERPFQCQYCDYASVTKKILDEHLESHLDERKYKCDKCSYAANRRTTLMKHKRYTCGKVKRKYTPYKNKAAIDFT